MHKGYEVYLQADAPQQSDPEVKTRICFAGSTLLVAEPRGCCMLSLGFIWGCAEVQPHFGTYTNEQIAT